MQTIVDETTTMNPSSFYGLTKSWSRQLLQYYRERRGVFAVTTILFNHESSLRRPVFITRKISMAAARAKLGIATTLHVRDMSSGTDWSSASDVVEGMWSAINAPQPADYVLASGRVHRVQDVLEIAFGSVDLDWRDFAKSGEPAPAPQGTLVGDATRARSSLGWKPKTGFDQMIRDMVASDIALLEAERT